MPVEKRGWKGGIIPPLPYSSLRKFVAHFCNLLSSWTKYFLALQKTQILSAGFFFTLNKLGVFVFSLLFVWAGGRRSELRLALFTIHFGCTWEITHATPPVHLLLHLLLFFLAFYRARISLVVLLCAQPTAHGKGQVNRLSYLSTTTLVQTYTNTHSHTRLHSHTYTHWCTWKATHASNKRRSHHWGSFWALL